jgi:hypothetical protein
MKKYSVLTAAMLGVTAIPSAQAIDITYSDPHNDRSFAGSNLGPSGPENNTVQYNAIANQSWDLEYFDLTGSNLSMTGGFNFLTGTGTGSTAVFPMGDIFVYLGGAPYSVPSAGDHDGPWTGRDGWDYVIHFDRNGGNNIRNSASGVGYSIIANQGQSINYTGGTQALTSGLPWYLTESFTPTEFATYGTFSDGEGWHNTIGGIDISSILDDGESFYLHTTMRCGNDVLWGAGEGTSQVPDGGAALCLLGLGVGAIGVLRRRMS